MRGPLDTTEARRGLCLPSTIVALGVCPGCPTPHACREDGLTGGATVDLVAAVRAVQAPVPVPAPVVVPVVPVDPVPAPIAKPRRVRVAVPVEAPVQVARPVFPPSIATLGRERPAGMPAHWVVALDDVIEMGWPR